MTAMRAGFSLVEIIVSMLILSVGVLAMGASTGYMLSEVRLAKFQTERSAAVREASERLRVSDWATLEAACDGNSIPAIGKYTVTCEVEPQGVHLKKINLISVGPGYRAGGVVDLGVVDTTAIILAEPIR